MTAVTSTLMCAICTRPDRPRRAQPGYRTCGSCADRLREAIATIPMLYNTIAQYWPVPGTSNTSSGRRSPGFASRSPANDHIIALTDRRSIGGDGHIHHAPSVLNAWATMVREYTGEKQPDHTDIDTDARLLIRRLDWVTRQEFIAELHDEIQEVLRQLRDANGERSVPAGNCPNIPAGHTFPCGAKLRAPLKGDTIRCGRCGRPYPRTEWLGRLQGAM